MVIKFRSKEDAKHHGRNDWERISEPISMGDRVGGFVTTCQHCGSEYEASYTERAIHGGNSVHHTPLHPDYDYLCGGCATAANERGDYILPEPRGWEDRIVHWTPGNTYHGPDAYGQVLSETEPDCRGNLFIYLVAPIKTAKATPRGDRYYTMTYDAVELVPKYAEPDGWD